MPDENGGPTPSENANQNAPPPPPSLPTIEERLAALEAESRTNREKEKPNSLWSEVKAGEWWLIRIGAATLLVNIVIAYIYYGQLSQMRIATEASTKATGFASDSLEQSEGQFERTVTQLIYQTASQAESAKATQLAAKAAQESLMQHDADRRPYVIGKLLGTVEVSPEKVIQTNLELINWGQSLAKDVALDGHIWYGENMPEMVDKYFAHLPKNPKSKNSFFLIPRSGEDDPKSPSFKYATIDSGNQAPPTKPLISLKAMMGALSLREGYGTGILRGIDIGLISAITLCFREQWPTGFNITKFIRARSSARISNLTATPSRR